MGRIADGGPACDTDGCEDPEPDMFACQNVLDASGRALDPSFLDSLSDPLARIVLKRPGKCPRSLSETVEKLRLEDTDRCQGDPRTGMLGRIVSERAQVLAKPDQVRAVVGRQCGRRLPYELMLHPAPIDADNPELPQSELEVMAFDRSAGVFNFYALEGEGEGAEWVFHGNSFDQLEGNSTCASCHADGGLTMREIDAPWVHWESPAVRTVGAGAVLDRFTELGVRGSGAEFSEVVRAGNAAWNRTRIAAYAEPDRTELHGGSTRPLLEPLFCGTTLNLQSAGGPNDVGGVVDVSAVPSSFFIDPAFGEGTTVPVDEDAYTRALSEVGSRLEGVVGPRDTYFGLTFVERAASDLAYVDDLLAFGIVDEEFVLDVLSVDFTAPVFSSARCGLLEFAPSFDDLSGTMAPPFDPPAVRSCCEAHADAGCDDAEIEACVCATDAYCCGGAWDQGCANVALEGGCGTCTALSRAPAEASPRSSAAAPSGPRLRNAFYVALQGETGAAAEFAEALATPDQASDHRDRVRRFVQACTDRAQTRDPEGFVRDLLEVAASRRAQAQASSELLDTPAAVTTDDLSPGPEVRLDPLSCELG